MPHIRTQIREAAIAALNGTGLPVTIQDSFAPAFVSDGLHLSASTPQTSVSRLTKDAGTPMESRVTLDLVAVQNTFPDTMPADMDELDLKAAAVLEDNRFSGLLFKPFFPVSTTAEFTKVGDTVVAKMTVRFEGTYHTKQADQSTAY